MKLFTNYFIELSKAKGTYPINHEDYYKIAIIGSSAAAGYAAEKGFGQIIQHELSALVVNKKIYIKNYAECGAPFYKYQAEIAKLIVNKFNMIIIYSGNNETTNYFYECKFYEKNIFTALLKERKKQILDEFEYTKLKLIKFTIKYAFNKINYYINKLRGKFNHPK